MVHNVKVILYYTGDGSDKVYTIQLLTGGGLGYVCARWGPRSHPETNYAIKYEGDEQGAKKAYDRLLAQKTKKGYTTDPAGRPGSFLEAEIDKALSEVEAPQVCQIQPVDEIDIDAAIEEARNERA